MQIIYSCFISNSMDADPSEDMELPSRILKKMTTKKKK